MHTDIRGFFSSDESYFEYFEPNNASSCLRAVNDLDAFVAAEGPFDGVIAYSQGVSVAATLMLQKLRQNPRRETLDPIFKCAIFLGASVPCDPLELEHGRVREMSFEADGEVINVPTTHVWGEHDPSTYPARLAQLCNNQQRSVYVHRGGHEIPGSQSKEAVMESVRVMKRAISMAQYQQ